MAQDFKGMNVSLWNRTEQINIISEINESILKIATIENHLYLLTATHRLYHGVVNEGERQLHLQLHQDVQFKDIDSCQRYLYVIDLEGSVFKYSSDLQLLHEILLINDSKVCSHGHCAIKFKMKVESLAIGSFGNLFVTNNGQLWGSGSMTQVGINSTNPKRIAFFDSRFTHCVNVGSDFAIVVASKQVRSEDTDSDEGEEDVFAPSCPHCNFVPNDLSKLEHLDSSSTSSRNSVSTASLGRSNLEQSSESSDCNERVAKNIIFRNTEAAREFLTRQFSWMSSAGEEYLAECTEKPTRIIKENVTNMASFVFEGVKTVGDKVATLSRHVSGSSDNCDVLEMTEDVSLPRITSKDEFMWSLSQATSERDNSDQGIQERCSTILRTGMNLLNCEVWTWGNVTYGQLGIGDGIKRERPIIITKLSNIGVRKVSVQGSHAGALTLDGRIYLWGRNDYNQVTIDSSVDQSSPRLFATNPEERFRDVACGLFQTAILSSQISLKYIGRQHKDDHRHVTSLYVSSTTDSDIQINNQNLNVRGELLVSAQYFLLNKNGGCCNYIRDFIQSEQEFLDDIILVHANLIKTIVKKTGTSADSLVYEQLTESYTEILHFTAANVQSLLDFSNGKIADMDIIMIRYAEEHMYIYKKYLGAINDALSIGALTQISKLIDISPNLYRAKLRAKKEKANVEEMVKCALMLPLQRLNTYPSLILELIVGLKRESPLFDLHNKWTVIVEEQEHKQREAEKTKDFWCNSGKTIDQFRTSARRLVRESHKHPIQLQNAGRFSSHWFILLTDVLVHVNGSTPHVHNLKTVWIDPPTEENYSQNQICLKLPEDTLILYASEPEQKAEWLQALTGAIRAALKVSNIIQLPIIRTAEHTFYKAGFYKDAKYVGRWSNGKIHGSGQLQWTDGRVYKGQFNNNQIHGFGRMEFPSVGVYEGLWKDNQQNGFGILKYTNGDVYKGCFKDGLPHGHGSLKHGSFIASAASIYIGDWVMGSKSGYGVMDDIVSGEKYLGTWSDNKKHGNGLIVTSEGIYYEGTFSQDVFTGHGLMILEDGTHYEGEFKGIDNINGKGVLTLNSGHTIEGHLNGSLSDGIKISNGTLNLTTLPSADLPVKPNSFGKLCTPVTQKWKALFRQCYQMLGVYENNSKVNKLPDTQKLWQNIAVLISNSHQGSLKKRKSERSLENSLNQLDTIPTFGRNSMDVANYMDVKQYLVKAFESPHHPLGSLLLDVTVAYTTTYGGLHAHPLLLTHAVEELHSITKRIYDIVKLLFPALPSHERDTPPEDTEDSSSEIVGYQNLLYPLILPKVHQPLFILYTLHNKLQDLQYWKRLTEWNKHSDYTLMSFLSVDQKFLNNHAPDGLLSSPVKEQTFLDAIETLQLLKTTFSPIEKLLIIRQTFEKMTLVVQDQIGHDYKWSMDDLFPVFLYVVVRSRILQLGSEIHFIEDFMIPSLENGELGIMFTTLKACYQQILQEKTSIS
ncbi:hypothetical protein PPYR_09640 [Photinus pyralis]|uniref:VPS9 domain-containing protein n=1 Tax=Photinus pyralis TaxID=7054 RepID=A0A5N4AMV6_PHOPY|nr:alsin-like isoform X2 [Photinus pyralis]KAB0798647.1 hypothetical protein PPYR_09640 [Photinus pyralis]